MAAQFGHEALAEMHDFPVRFAFRVEVRAAFAAADGKAGQGVLEDLFKSQELQDAQVDALVEAQAAFVRADGAVGLDAVAAVDVEDAVVIFPGDAENDDAFRFDDAFQDVVLFIFRFLFQHGHEGRQYFAGCVLEFRLFRVTALDDGQHVFYILLHFCHNGFSFE